MDIVQKPSKVFVSHASKDVNYVLPLIELLEDIGLKQEHLFCSSLPGYGIPNDEDIYKYLKHQFHDYRLHVIFILSQNYYQSIPCLNEMGAAWVLHDNYTTVLLPGYKYHNIKGAINPRQIGLKLDSDLLDLKERLNQFKDHLNQEFNLDQISSARWDRKRDAFIQSIRDFSSDSVNLPYISRNATELLQYACEQGNGEIRKIDTITGSFIESASRNFITPETSREIAKWKAVLKELSNAAFIELVGGKGGEIYNVTAAGYDFIDNYKAP